MVELNTPKKLAKPAVRQYADVVDRSLCLQYLRIAVFSQAVLRHIE